MHLYHHVMLVNPYLENGNPSWSGVCSTHELIQDWPCDSTTIHAARNPAKPLALLEERGVEMEIVRYLDDGILEEDLQLLASLDGIVRKKEAGAEAMAALHSVDDVAALLKSNPKVLERPVLVANGQAVIGRPPEDVLQLVE